MHERSKLELEDEMARVRGELKLAAEQERVTRERHTRQLTPKIEAAHEARLEEMNRLLEAYHGMAQ